jgi:hypothetical protein
MRWEVVGGETGSIKCACCDWLWEGGLGFVSVYFVHAVNNQLSPPPHYTVTLLDKVKFYPVFDDNSPDISSITLF